MAGGSSGNEANLELTPTWIIALVCTFIVAISLLAERSLHILGKKLEKKKQKSLYEALLKIKEELMLMGFISLLLVVFQGVLVKICVSQNTVNHMLPCRKAGSSTTAHAVHFSKGFMDSRHRLLEGGASGGDSCTKKGKVSLLSIKAIHDLHIFIFVLAVTHIIFSAITLLLSFLRIRQWKHWEDSIHKEVAQNQNEQGQIVFLKDDEFIQGHYSSGPTAWLFSFAKQFYASVTKVDYKTMRLGFIKTHCPGNPKFNFYRYMIRALEADFQKVVGISWYLWIYVVMFLLLNVDGWYLYFWVAFIPFGLLLAVGTELEHVILRLARDVAQKQAAVEGQLVIKPSDEHFWFGRPILLLYLLHFILFQNAFEIAFFFWILTTYGFDSCIMRKVGYLIPRLVIGAFVQFLFSYSTLPLYAIVTQMGSAFKKEVFAENLQAGLIGWAQKVRMKRGGESAVGARSPASRGGDVLLQNMAGQREIKLDSSPS